MEHSVFDYIPQNLDPGGKFLQIAGLIVHYNIANAKGERVVSIKVGQPNQSPESLHCLVSEKIYSVALPSYLVGGGDGYKMIPKNLIDHKNTGFLMQDLVAHFVRNNSPIQKPVLGRIIFMSKHHPTSCSENDSTTSAGQLKQEITTTFHYYIIDIVLVVTCLILS